MVFDTGWAPIPPFDGFEGFSRVKLGGSSPDTWTRVDMIDSDGDIELETIRP